MARVGDDHGGTTLPPDEGARTHGPARSDPAARRRRSRRRLLPGDPRRCRDGRRHGLRDEDLRRRESELSARHEGLDTREAELSRREAEWREREGPSVADVVTGRAEGNVHEGTASWGDEPRSAGSVERPAETRTGRRADHVDQTDQTDQTGQTGQTEAVDPADTSNRTSTEEHAQRDGAV